MIPLKVRRHQLLFLQFKRTKDLFEDAWRLAKNWHVISVKNFCLHILTADWKDKNTICKQAKNSDIQSIEMQKWSRSLVRVRHDDDKRNVVSACLEERAKHVTSCKVSLLVCLKVKAEYSLNAQLISKECELTKKDLTKTFLVTESCTHSITLS